MRTLSCTVIVTVATLLGLLPVYGASFDCSKAKSVFEHTICDNLGLSAADETMFRAYSVALAGLSEGAEGALRASQKTWLDAVGMTCARDAEPAADGYAECPQEDLVQAFEDRELTLEQSRMLGGLRLTFVDHDEQRSMGGKAGAAAEDRYVAYAQIDGSDAEATTFNAIVAHSLIDDSTNESPDGTDTSQTLWVSAVTSSRITLIDTDYSINHGAAHGYYTLTYVHYLRKEHRTLTADDVFGKDGWQDRLRRLTLDALKVSLGDGLIDDDPQSEAAISEGSVDPAHWDFPAEGLRVQFGQGEVASPVMGAVSVIIPWSLIENDLTPGIGVELRDGL